LTADHEFFPIGGWPFLELVPEALIDMFGDNLTGGSMRHDRDQSWGEREFQELVFAVTVDEQFRIIIPLRAREHIKLGPDDEITIVWRGSFLEIWRSADYKAAKEAYYKGH
jgi:DNA-binding transcriptional regulator/RsmH inhibitor MraZ